MSILRLTGLSDRILKDIDDLSLANEEIDFTNANRILEQKRLESINILKSMIEN